jgi:hypothetical protein
MLKKLRLESMFTGHYKTHNPVLIVSIQQISNFSVFLYLVVLTSLAILVAARSKTWFCSRSLAGISGSNPASRLECLSVVNVVCCQVEVVETG